MYKENNKKCVIIGAGIAGIAAAIRMRNKGYTVDVYEANSFPGGKLSSESINGYRFDLGPSVFTMPSYVDELFELSGRDPRAFFNYTRLDPAYRYFYENGTVLDAYDGKEQFAARMASQTDDSKEDILRFLQRTEDIYDLTAEVFLNNSLHKIRNYFTKHVLKGVFNFGKIGAFATMDEVNRRSFKDPRLVQLFNRYATYNGSSPFLAPATLNVIPFVEIIKGAYYPVGGMITITDSLVQLAKDIGVKFHFSTTVREIMVANKTATGIKTDNETFSYDVVICNGDIYNSYQKLLPTVKKPLKILNQQKSSSGIIFYWGVKSLFPQLCQHNIFFSAQYDQEFESIFTKKDIYSDPTIYLNISGKLSPADAPPGCENWFVFINVPNNTGQDWGELINRSRENITRKLNRMLGIDLAPMIETEIVHDPTVIERRTSSAFGSIYGNSSNNKYAAFYRHPNFSREISHLYFCGGSVHPGASIPLCLLSAKITTGLIK